MHYRLAKGGVQLSFHRAAIVALDAARLYDRTADVETWARCAMFRPEPEDCSGLESLESSVR